MKHRGAVVLLSALLITSPGSSIAAADGAVSKEEVNISSDGGSGKVLEGPEGITVAEAEDFSRGNAALTKVADLYPEDFTASEIEEDGVRTVGFSGKAPAEAVAILRGADPDVIIRENLGYTESQMIDAVSDAFDRVQDVVDSSIVVVTPGGLEPTLTIEISNDSPISTESPGVRSRDIDVEIDPQISGKAKAEALGEAAAVSVQKLQDNSPFEIEVTVVPPRETVPDANLNGGVKLSTCTGGFTVRNSSNVSGLSSAGHCVESQKYAGSASILTVVKKVFDLSGDVGWWRNTSASYTVTSNFQYDSGLYRKVNYFGKFEKGQNICKYGEGISQ